MDALSYKTISLNKETVQKEWLIVDATDQVAGRFCSRVAYLLRGKHKPGFTPHVDCGDHVIVINAEKIKFTGKKLTNKEYVHYTGYPGGQRFTTPEKILAKNPARIIEEGVQGMLPKNRLGRAIYKNLHVYTGPNHGHEAQKPKAININTIII